MIAVENFSILHELRFFRIKRDLFKKFTSYKKILCQLYIRAAINSARNCRNHAPGSVNGLHPVVPDLKAR